MKKFALIIFMALLVPLQACAAEQAKWEEGKHYKVLDEPASDKPVITEFSLTGVRTVFSLSRW